ncbi:MAG: hypothetical protein RMJ15_08490 [Nitrososphaerota archaeon]|nr:hypothetical protein [Candidatus Bathyarchaeota archaeon]MDW8023755.1 hypothetical protein [Nitrososphaerota archaeon]
MGKLKIKTHSGQTIEVSWETVEEAERAAKLFDEYTKKGYVAVAENPNTGEYTFVYSFDPALKKIDMVPLVYGGTVCFSTF